MAVVIVTYASSAVIADCLAAVRDALHDVGPSRVIVVDNCSPDDTCGIVTAISPDVELVRRPSNDGFAAGVNAGIAAAPGSDVLVLNADVQLAPAAVIELRRALARPGVGIAVPRLLTATGDTHRSLRRAPTVLRAVGDAVLGGTRAGHLPMLGETVLSAARYARAGRVDWATGAAWLVSSECLARIGRLDERYFLYSEETEFMLRAADHGFAVHYEPRARAVHLGGQQPVSPRLSALAVANRIRLHRERRGRMAAAAMWVVVALHELTRVLAHPQRRAVHVVTLRELVRMRRWPTVPAGQPAIAEAERIGPGYLCFSAQDWWYHNRAHSDFQLMRRVAQHRRVLLVNSIGMRMPLPGRSTQALRRILRKARSVAMLVRRPLPEVPNLAVMTPLVLPFYGRPWLRRINAALVRAQVRAVSAALRLGRPVVVATIPTSWDVVRPMIRHTLLFNRSDRYSAFPESDQALIAGLEHELLRNSDRVLYVSRALLAEEQALTGERAHFLDHGVDLAHFYRRVPAQIPADLRAVPGPRIGFFGSLDDYLVDFELLESVAREIPDASLVLIGDATRSMHRLTSYSNVHWLGYQPYELIPGYGSGFDVALMPWLDNQWIRHSNPIKLKEYLALGLPIVSTDFAEVHRYADRIRIATTPEQFVSMIRQTLLDGGLQTPLARRESVLDASWDARAEELMSLAEGSP